MIDGNMMKKWCPVHVGFATILASEDTVYIIMFFHVPLEPDFIQEGFVTPEANIKNNPMPLSDMETLMLRTHVAFQ